MKTLIFSILMNSSFSFDMATADKRSVFFIASWLKSLFSRWSWSLPSASPAWTNGTSSQMRLCPRGLVTTGGWRLWSRTALKRRTPSPTARGGSCGRVTAALATPSRTPSPNFWLWDDSDLRSLPCLFLCVTLAVVVACRTSRGWRGSWTRVQRNGRQPWSESESAFRRTSHKKETCVWGNERWFASECHCCLGV